MSYLNLRQNKAFKEKFYKCLSHQFNEKITASMRKTLQQDSTFINDVIVLYNDKKALVFKDLVVVVYCFIEKYVCVDYLCLQRKATLSSLHRGFGDR